MRLSTEKAIEFVENLEKYHPIQKYWDESNERHRQEKNTENYPYSYFRGVLIRKIAEIIEALQQENNGWQERYYELDAGHSRLFKDFCKLQKENEQLQAQVTRVREALRKAREALDYWRELYGIGLEVLNWHVNGYIETFDSFYDSSGTYKALAEIDKVIGGKEDV